MRSFIKIYGPPILKAIRALEKVAVDMPEVCIMNPIIEQSMSATDVSRDAPEIDSGVWAGSYFAYLSTPITEERCSNIISKSGESLGEYDFYFEWFTEPTMEQLHDLIEKIDESLSQLGCKYTITSKK